MGSRAISGITPHGLSGALFSKTQRQVLGLLFGNPERTYYANEIVRHADAGIGSVQRELEKLTKVGLLVVTRVGNQKHYQANQASPIFEELRGIVQKTFGLADVLRESLTDLSEKIRVAFVYGSVAKRSDTASSDVDVLIISSKLSYSDVLAYLTEAETRLGRTINPTLYKPGDFSRKLGEESAFLKAVMSRPKVFLIGTENDIPKPAKSG